MGILVFATASRPALGPTQPPIQWVPGAPSLGEMRPGREADNSPPSNAEVKNEWSYTSTRPYVIIPWCLIKGYVFMTWDLVKHRDNFPFT
jgi:hypothetical protein